MFPAWTYGCLFQQPESCQVRGYVISMQPPKSHENPFCQQYFLCSAPLLYSKQQYHLLLSGLSISLICLSLEFLSCLSMICLRTREGGNFPFSHSGLWASKDVLTAHSYQDFVAFFDHLAHACDTGVVPAVPRWGSRGEILSLWHIHVSLLDGEVDCRCSWDGAPQVQAVTLVQMCGRRFQLGFGK